MDDFQTALQDIDNLVDAAATDAKDISDLPTRNVVEMLIRAVRELRIAVAFPR